MPRLFASPQLGQAGIHVNTIARGGFYPPGTLTVLERKIRPDINLFAEKLESLHDHEDNQNEEEVRQEHLETSALGMADFVGLQPSARSRRSYKEAHNKDNKPGLERPHKALPSGEATHNNPSYSISSSPTRHALEQPPMSSSLKWPAFGKCLVPSAPKSGSGDNVQIHDISKFESQSSLEISQSFETCHSRPISYRRKGKIPQTPESKTGSQQSQHHPTPSYGGELPVTALPSPHIFGMHAQLSGLAPEQDTDVSEYFDFKETPPPLPPLDHPAFQKGPPSSFKFPSTKYKFPDLPGLQEFGVGVQGSPVGRKTTHSLPSLRRSGNRRSNKPFDEVHKSLRSHSGSNAGVDPSSETKNSRHSRQQSRSSIASSRRSSAEYSAKQVSSIAEDMHRMQDGCWEVEVSKAMVNLALGREGPRIETRPRNEPQTRTRRQSQDAHTSSFGSKKARGKNRASGGDLGLGSPFILQDTRRDNRADSQSSRDHSARTALSAESYNHSAAIEHSNLRNTVMNGESILRPTGSSAIHTIRKGKEKEVAPDTPSPPGSRSRRTGRAISSPSSTQGQPPEPAKLDIASAYGTVQRSATLQPPQVSIISATPEGSPLTASARRGHHKSTPTMPTASVLKTPSTPPVIEKSYSTSSGKRKADEAGVSGDKTPPKESRGGRTTFAPEPRPHRASATSGVSTHAPSSFNRSKRVRLTETPEGRGSYRSASRVGSLPTPNDSPPNAKNTGSWSSRGSHAAMSQSSHTYGPPPAISASHASYSQHQHRAPSRRSLSQASIPISALISPHAPSIGRLSTFHMRDPRKPNPIQSTPWTLSFPSAAQPGESHWSPRGWIERGGSPLHAWLFFIGFILFPLWWAAALFIPIPRTRTLGEAADAEKGVILDDPQVEHDAKSWRTRCRVMAGVSLLTYVPFIVLVAIYA